LTYKHAGTLIATILRHDRKTASYKFALICSLSALTLRVFIHEAIWHHFTAVLCKI